MAVALLPGLEPQFRVGARIFSKRSMRSDAESLARWLLAAC
jgi:hypothetical protein